MNPGVVTWIYKSLTVSALTSVAQHTVTFNIIKVSRYKNHRVLVANIHLTAAKSLTAKAFFWFRCWHKCNPLLCGLTAFKHFNKNSQLFRFSQKVLSQNTPFSTDALKTTVYLQCRHINCSLLARYGLSLAVRQTPKWLIGLDWTSLVVKVLKSTQKQTVDWETTLVFFV